MRQNVTFGLAAVRFWVGPGRKYKSFSVRGRGVPAILADPKKRQRFTLGFAAVGCRIGSARKYK